MNVGEPRLETTCKGLIRQESVEIHRRFGNADPVPLGRHRGMEVGEGAAIVEPCAFWHKGIDQLENTVGTVDEPAQDFVRSEEHTSELQSLMRISYAVFCLNKNINNHINSPSQYLVINTIF